MHYEPPAAVEDDMDNFDNMKKPNEKRYLTEHDEFAPIKAEKDFEFERPQSRGSNRSFAEEVEDEIRL